jgi:hypothetical protein
MCTYKRNRSNFIDDVQVTDDCPKCSRLIGALLWLSTSFLEKNPKKHDPVHPVSSGVREILRILQESVIPEKVIGVRTSDHSSPGPACG